MSLPPAGQQLILDYSGRKYLEVRMKAHAKLLVGQMPMRSLLLAGASHISFLTHCFSKEYDLKSLLLSLPTL